MLKNPFDEIDIGNWLQRMDNAIHQINHYSADRVVCFNNTYPLDSDLSGGYPSLEQLGPGHHLGTEI